MEIGRHKHSKDSFMDQGHTVLLVLHNCYPKLPQNFFHDESIVTDVLDENLNRFNKVFVMNNFSDSIIWDHLIRQ
jgi:hypothetical protein